MHVQAMKNMQTMFGFITKRDLARSRYYPSQILASIKTYLWTCVRMKRWVQSKKKRGVEGGERDIIKITVPISITEH